MCGKKVQAIKTVIQGNTEGGIRTQNFKVLTTSMFKQLKETKLKELKESIMRMSHQIKNMNKELQIIF